MTKSIKDKAFSFYPLKWFISFDCHKCCYLFNQMGKMSENKDNDKYKYGWLDRHLLDVHVCVGGEISNPFSENRLLGFILSLHSTNTEEQIWRKEYTLNDKCVIQQKDVYLFFT